MVDVLYFMLREHYGLKVKGDDQKAGVDSLKKALQSLVHKLQKMLVLMAQLLLEKFIEGKKSTQGYDAQSEEYC